MVCNMEKIYYDPNHPAALGGVAKLQKAVGKTAATWLETQRAYTLHKPMRHRFPTRKTRGSHHAMQFQADLNDMITYKNKGFRYILTVVDIFSRFAWAQPLKTKTGIEMVEAFKKIFRDSKPHYLQTDQGSEFENKVFQAFLKKQGVKHFSVKSPYKASLVERFNRTLKTRMFRYFTYQGSYEWVKVLPQLVDSYNRSSHRSLPKGMTPLEASNAESQYRVWQNQEKDDTIKKSKFKLGDQVRISKVKGTFEKGYLPNWSEEIFTIDKIDRRTSPIMYVLKDEGGETIEGKFYVQELQKVKEELFAIEKIIRRKGSKYLVKFLGYPGQHWVDELHRYKQS